MLVIKLTAKNAKTTNSNIKPKQAKNCTAMNHALFKKKF